MKTRSSLVSVALVCAVATPAFAASSASASFGPLNIQLIDLAPLDGQAPWLAFNDAAYNNVVSAYAYQRPNAEDRQSVLTGGSWTPAAISASAGVAQAVASISGPGTALGSSLAASGAVANFYSPSPFDMAGFDGRATSPSDGFYASDFTLSAHTLLVVSTAASVAATGEFGGSPYGAYSQGSASLAVRGPGAGGGGLQSADDSIAVSGFASSADTSFAKSSDRELTLSFVNLTGSDMTGQLRVETTVFGYTYANPVPEPETYALMLAGLAVMGLLVRRRRG